MDLIIRVLGWFGFTRPCHKIGCGSLCHSSRRCYWSSDKYLNG